MTKKKTLKKRPERLGRITFVYGKNVRVSKEKEAAFRMTANMWFSPFIKEMNTQKVKTIATFLTEYNTEFRFENITYDLKRRVISYYNQHRTTILS